MGDSDGFEPGQCHLGRRQLMRRVGLAATIASDTGSARAVDRELREIMTIDENPVDGILGRAASGTRFEGFYDRNDGETVEYRDPDEQDDDQEDADEVEQ